MIWGFAGISDSFLVAAVSVNQLHAAVPVYRLAFSQRAPRNARPHEVSEGRTVRLRWFHAGIHVLHGRAYFPPTITPAAGRSARGKAALRGNTAPDWVSRLIAHEPQTARRSRSLFNGPPSRLQQAAVHPLRRDTPVTSRCTRSEGV